MKSELITATSVSGGMTSAYLAANYPTQYNIFSLVRSSNPKTMFKDLVLKRIVEDRIGMDFIGTLEDDIIITTMVNLEQYLGKPIQWVTSRFTFEEMVRNRKHLPNMHSRFCTTELKLIPIFEWFYFNAQIPVEMNIGFRANETERAERAIAKTDKDGFSVLKHTVSKHTNGWRADKGQNKWEEFAWQRLNFPLIKDGIFKKDIIEFWKDKPVKFATINNCRGCYWADPMYTNWEYNFTDNRNKIEAFNDMELELNATFRDDCSFNEIINWKPQLKLDFDDFSSCDTGGCEIN